MNKRELLDKLSGNGEERLLLSRVWDKWEQCQKRNIPTVTDFLTPQEQSAAEKMLHAIGVWSGFQFCGGYEDAERRMLYFLPDWQEEIETDEVRCLHVTFYEHDRLSHRDFLGSLMGLGLTRGKIGDILVHSDCADIMVAQSVAAFVCDQMTSAGRISVKVKEIPLQELTMPEVKVREIHDTVPSLRLDCVIAAGFSTSRSKAAEAISMGRVQINHTLCQKVDRMVSEGDTFSVRGAGKCVLASVGNVTKKGRTFVTLQRYI